MPNLKKKTKYNRKKISSCNQSYQETIKMVFEWLSYILWAQVSAFTNME